MNPNKEAIRCLELTTYNRRDIVREMFGEVFSDVYERVMLATDCHDTYYKTDMIRVPSALGYFSVVYIISNPLPDLNYLYRSIQQNYLNILNT